MPLPLWPVPNFVAPFVIATTLVGCHGGFASRENSPLVTNFSGFFSEDDDRISTQLFVQYEQSSGMATVYNEQEFSLSKVDEPIVNSREFGVLIGYYPGRARPLTIGLTNMWTPAERQEARVDLDFVLRSDRIQSGQTYRCTQDPKAVCNFNQSLAEFRMDLSKGELVCLLQIQTQVALDFANSGDAPSKVSFPSIRQGEIYAGKPLALALRCSRGQSTVIEAHFLHNANQIPSLSP